MSIRTITEIKCDGCGKTDADVEIVSTKVAKIGFGGAIYMREASSADLVERARKRRDYCHECVESDIFYCEECHQSHQSICPKEEAKLDAWHEANKDNLAALQYADAALEF